MILESASLFVTVSICNVNASIDIPCLPFELDLWEKISILLWLSTPVHLTLVIIMCMEVLQPHNKLLPCQKTEWIYQYEICSETVDATSPCSVGPRRLMDECLAGDVFFTERPLGKVDKLLDLLE